MRTQRLVARLRCVAEATLDEIEADAHAANGFELDVRVGIGEIDIDRDLFGVAAVTDADTTQG